MGTGRESSNVRQQHKQHKARKHRDTPAKSAAANMKHMVLRLMSPKAGMIYPFKKTLMTRQRYDCAVATTLKRSEGISKVSRGILDNAFSLIFGEATSKLLERKEEMEGFKENPIEFIRSLRARPSLCERWPASSIDHFAALFLILRAARRNWHDNPQLPYDRDQHCNLAREIDSFEAIDALDWAHLSFVNWLVGGGIDIPAVEEDDEAVDIVVDEEDDNAVDIMVDDKAVDEIMEVDEAGPTTTGPTTAAAAPAHGPVAVPIADEVSKLAAGLRRLHISIPDEVLAEAFARLRLEEQPADPAEVVEDAEASVEDGGNAREDEEDEDVI